MIVIKELLKNYNNLSVLNGVNLSISSNTLTLITGESGCGKTTLLNLIGLMDVPTGGEILIDGTDYHKKSDKEQSKFRNSKIGYIFQDFKLDSDYSIFENLELPLLIANVKKKEREKNVLEALESVGLSEKAKVLPSELSGGQKQRVAIARAIINKAEIILADEPCGNLDEKNATAVYELLANLKKTKTIILVSHSPNDVCGVDLKVKLEKGRAVLT